MFGSHTKIALQLSGGKDSVACLYLMRPHLDRIVVYHLNTGDEPPETTEVLNKCRAFIPHYQEVNTNSVAWREANGVPSDLVPTYSTFIGRTLGFGKTKISDRFECCWSNVMQPMHSRMKADGITLIIRGQKLSDMPTVPLKNGQSSDGFQFLYPIENWTDEDVFAYLKEQKAPMSDIYSVRKEGTDCLHCTAWWNYRSIDWLEKKHPQAYQYVKTRQKEIRLLVEDHMRHLDAD